MRSPDFMDSNDARFLVHSYFGDLRRVRISRRRTDSSAFMFASASLWRRRVRPRSCERTAEIDGRNDRFFERHLVLRTFILALLLHRMSKNLPFDASGDRGFGGRR